MAKAPLNVIISNTTYTVPANKYAVFAAYVIVAPGGSTFRNGVCTFPAASFAAGTRIAPLTANAGDTIDDTSSGATVCLSGFLYDQ